VILVVALILSRLFSRSPAATTAKPVEAGSGDKAGTEKSWTVPGGPAAAIALVVATLAAVGVAGDVLTRWARNEPNEIFFVVAGVLVAVTAPTYKAAQGKWPKIGIVLLLAVLLASTFSATRSLTERELPRVSLSGESDENGVLKITVDGSGSSLRSSDDMLIQVVGLKELDDFDAAVSECEVSRLRRVVGRDASGRPLERPFGSETSDVILWQRFGPDPTGSVAATISTQVSRADYKGICAWAALRTENDPQQTRTVAAYLPLMGLPAKAATTDTTATPATQ
jgi:hypothetical protein